MSILIENLQEKLEVKDDLYRIIEQCLEKILSNEGILLPCEVNVLLVDNKKIHQINREHRNVDKATDVLSFPMVEMDEGTIVSSEGDFDLDEGSLVLGDIVISTEKAHEQAIEYGHTLEREIGFLATHGLLHLLGYDHETLEQEEKMRQRQEAVLKELQLSR